MRTASQDSNNKNSKSSKEPHKNFAAKSKNDNIEWKENEIKLLNRFTVLDEVKDETEPSPVSMIKKMCTSNLTDKKKKRKQKEDQSESIVQLDMISENNEVRDQEFEVVKPRKASNKRRYRQCKVAELRLQMIKSKTNLKQFETYNIYNLLIPEYKIEDKKLDTVRILPRKKLRKCLKCGFKKRSCVLDPQNCTAMNNFCFRCERPGHFPKSMNCKSSKKD